MQNSSSAWTVYMTHMNKRILPYCKYYYAQWASVMAATEERCMLCRKLVAAGERRMLNIHFLAAVHGLRVNQWEQNALSDVCLCVNTTHSAQKHYVSEARPEMQSNRSQNWVICMEVFGKCCGYSYLIHLLCLVGHPTGVHEGEWKKNCIDHSEIMLHIIEVVS